MEYSAITIAIKDRGHFIWVKHRLNRGQHYNIDLKPCQNRVLLNIHTLTITIY